LRTRSPLPDFTSTFADRAIVARQCRRGLIPAHRLKVRANKKYLLAIIEKIGLKKLNEIDQALMGWLAEQIYPDRTAATINQQLYTPVIAVMKFARHAYQLKRPEGHDNLPALDVPANDWYPAVVRAANPYLRAFLMVQRMTGRRPDELLNRTRDHYVRETGALMVWDGKGKQFISLEPPGTGKDRARRATRSARGPKKGRIAKGQKLTFAKRTFLFGTNNKSTSPCRGCELGQLARP